MVIIQTQTSQKQVPELFLKVAIRFFCISAFVSLWLPFLLVSFSSNIIWDSVSGMGFGKYADSWVFAPVLFSSGLIASVYLFQIWFQSGKSIIWDHVKPGWLLFCIYIFQLLTKRQQFLIVFEDPIRVQSAQLYYVPHPGVGFFVFIFSIIAIIGLIGIRGQHYNAPIQLFETHIEKIGLIAAFLFILPFFFSYDGSELKILLGIGYGFVWDGTTFSNAAAMGGWIVNSFQIFLLLLIVAFKGKRKVKMILEVIVLALGTYFFTQVGFAIWRLYIPGGHQFPIYPPLSIFMVILWWTYANIAWDFLASL
ncbi:hypothetical protein [Candidatus Lokiarchaeum ossiferum]|uniref:hypothetical protein n=1 Tax=Candidatus Lokiarchaeum ossiferum TaxID=2951803 RepID=UPI00352F3FC5